MSNIIDLNPSQESTPPSKSVKYNLKNGDKDVKVCLMPGLRLGNVLNGRYVTDGTFKAVDNDTEITATPEEGILLDHVQDFDYVYPPTIESIRVKVKSELNQLAQMSQKLAVNTTSRKGIATSRVVEAKHEGGDSFIYHVNEQITLDKHIILPLLASISVDIEVNYAE